MPTPASSSEVSPPADRLRSLDALRGFDMFWIVGGEHLIHALAVHTGATGLVWFSGQLRHPGWTGFALYDLIFPLFLFLAGVSVPYSVRRQRELGKGNGFLVRKAAKRMLWLIALGAVYNGALRFAPLDQTRLCSVLGYIGVTSFCATLLYLYADLRHQILWALGILFGYWAVLVWVPVPGFGAGVLTPQGCITGYLDRSLLPWGLNFPGVYDSQGILVTLPAIVTCQLGIFTGKFLLCSGLQKRTQALLLLGTSPLFYLAGRLWETQLFISKELWNPPFVLHCAAWSLVLFGLFYLIIDVAGFRKWAFVFVVIGMNSILIYVGTQVVDVMQIAMALFGGLTGKVEGSLRPVLEWTAYISTWWLGLYFCYRRRIFLKV
jgi:predicted acyltransferase